MRPSVITFYLILTIQFIHTNICFSEVIATATTQDSDDTTSDLETVTNTINDDEHVKKQPSQNDTKNDNEVKLEDLTIEELEQICTSRGFELVKDVEEQSGQVKQYSHQDYVDAARQCLEIEAEMEQILKENPDLVQDLEKEADRLQDEKNRLENELKEATAKLEELNNDVNIQQVEQQQQEEQQENQSSQEVLNDDDDSATLPIENDTLESNTSMNSSEDNDTKDQTNATVNENSHEDSNNTIDEIDTAESNEEGTNDSDYIDLDTIQEDHKKETTNDTILDKDEQRIDNDNKQTALQTDNTDGTILSLSDIVNEFRDQIRDDIERVVNLILPTHIREPLMENLKPAIRILKAQVLSTYDMVKRYTIVFMRIVNEKIKDSIPKDNDSKDIQQANKL